MADRMRVASLIGGTTRPGQSWGAINNALKEGRRGLPGGESLPRLLAPLRAADPEGRARKERPACPIDPNRLLTVEKILAWADEHKARTGCYPTALHNIGIV